MRFDPMTGQPIPENPVPENLPIEDNEEEINFDPMTGQPIRKQPEQPQQAPPEPEISFDPMTGQPITGKPGTGFSGTDFSGTGFSGTDFSGTDGTSTPPKSKSIKIPIIVGCVSLGVAAIAFAVFFALSSGLFLGSSGKVLVAINNTAKKTPRIAEALKPLETMCDGKYTIAFSGDIEGVSFEGEFRNGGKEKQVFGKADSDGSNVEMLAGIDGKAARLSVPALTKYVLTYNYTGKNSGYLMDNMDEEEINAINALCEAAAKETDAKKVKSDVIKVFADEFKSLKFDSVGKEEYEVDGKDVKCAGYQTVITSDNLVNIVDEYQKIVEKEFDFMNDSEAFGMDNVAESFDELRAQCEDMDEIEATFYLYKKQLAAIVLVDVDTDEKAEICFEGGDYRMQNIRIRADESQVRLSGKTTDKKETFKLEEKYGLKGSWNEIASLDYAFESGKFTISANGSTIKGGLTSSGSEVSLKISEISSGYYNVSPDLAFTVKKGAKMEKFSGKEFDIGNADEDDVADLQSDVYDNLMDEDLGFLMDAFGYYW